jgi:type III secretion protein R
MENPFPIIALASVLLLVPFAVVSITAFVKIAVVLFLLRSALGIQQTPPNLVLYGVTIVLTAYVGMPVFAEAYEAVTAVGGDASNPLLWGQMAEAGMAPVREFLMRMTTEEDRLFFQQAAIELHGDSIDQFTGGEFFVLAPAFVTAELTRAFEICVLLYLPFIVIDLVITNILTAMGMMMVSPMIISLPFKLLLFVAADGWTRLTHGLVLSYV